MKDEGNMTILIKEDEIKTRVRDLAEAISCDFGFNEIFIIALLKGSFVFLTDLIREFHRLGSKMVIEFIDVSSHSGGNKESPLVWNFERTSLSNKAVLLLDDILDTGETLSKCRQILGQEKLGLLKICVLLVKDRERRVDITPDYFGFKVPNKFVVGYGLDNDGRFRELPYIAVEG